MVVLVDAGARGIERLEVVRSEQLLASAVVVGIREAEREGGRVLRIAEREPGVLTAADLILRLRRVICHLTEEEAALLLELLPL